MLTIDIQLRLRKLRNLVYKKSKFSIEFNSKLGHEKYYKSSNRIMQVYINDNSVSIKLQTL